MNIAAVNWRRAVPSVKSFCYYSCENLFKFSFPPLFPTLVLYDSWTMGILNAQYLLLYCTPSK